MRFALLLVVLSAAVLVVPAASADVEILVAAPEGTLEIEAGSSGSATAAVQIRTTGDNLCFTQGPVALSLATNTSSQAPGLEAKVTPEALNWEIPPGFHSSTADTAWTSEAQSVTVVITVAPDAPRNLTDRTVLLDVAFDGEPPANCQGTFEAKVAQVELPVSIVFTADPEAPAAPGPGTGTGTKAPTTAAPGGNGTGPAGDDSTPSESPALGIGLGAAVLVATLALLYRRR